MYTAIPSFAADFGLIRNNMTVKTPEGRDIALSRGEKVSILEEGQWQGEEEPFKLFRISSEKGECEIAHRDISPILAETETIYAAYTPEAFFARDNYFEHHNLLFLDKTGTVLKEVPLEYEQGASFFRLNRLLQGEMDDRNGDGKKELILQGEYMGGFYYADGYGYNTVSWYSLEDNIFNEELSYWESGGGVLVEDYIESSSLRFFDRDRDGFNEILQIHESMLLDMDLNRPEGQSSVLVSTFYRYRENEGYRYMKGFPHWATLNDSRVRLREEPNLSCDTLGYLTAGEKVLLLDMTVEKQTIGDAEYPWYKLRTADYTIGWAYGQFIDLPSRE